MKMKITLRNFELIAICPNCGNKVKLSKSAWQRGGNVFCPKCKTNFWPTFTVLEFIGQKCLKPKSPAWKGWRLESKNKM